MSDFGMEAEAQEHITLWDSKIEAGPFLPNNGELLHGIDPTFRRHHRYGDDTDEHSAQLDYRSPDSKGHESDPVDDESDESGTYLGLWKRQMAGHDGCPVSQDTTSPDTMALGHEDMPIRPGIGPGSYARTFEELLENTLRGQEIVNPAGVSIADSQLISAKHERRSISSEKCQDRTCADTRPGGSCNRHGPSNKEGITLQEVCSDDVLVGQMQGLCTTAKAESCSLGSIEALPQRATQALQPFLPPFQKNGCFEPIDCGPEMSIKEQGDKTTVFDPKQIAIAGPGFRGEIMSHVADLNQVEGTMTNLLDGTASYPISSCEDSISLEEKASYPVSSCEDSVSLEEKESVENEFNKFCSVNHLEDCLLKEGRVLDKEQEEQTRQHSPKELHIHQLGVREIWNAEVETEDSNNETVKFEDILALLKLRTRKDCKVTAAVLNDKLCERDAMDDILTSQQVDFNDESNSCRLFQVFELARNYGSETRKGKFEVQLPCVHSGTSVQSHELCAHGDLEHIHLSGSTTADSDSEVLCVPDNNVNGLCLDIDSYPSYSMKVVHPDEPVHSALKTSVRQQQHQPALHGADTILQLGTVTDGEPYQECGFPVGTSKDDLDQQAFDTPADQGCQFDVSNNGQAGLLGLDTERPLRACLVPLRDLVNRPGERGAGRHVAPDKHKAVLLYKNPLWADESFQDLPLLMSNCQLQDESKSTPINYGDSAVHSGSSPKKVDRRRGWNIDASVSVNALRMASLLLPDEEVQEAQQNVSEEYDGRPCRKRCKGLLYNETYGSEPWNGMCEERLCEDDCENCDASWLSRNSLSDGYVTEIIVGNEGEGTVEEKVDFLNRETNPFETQRRSTNVVQCDRSQVFAAHVVPEEDFDAQQLPDTYDATDSVDELLSVVEQENQVETAIGRERERSSGSGWFFPLNECGYQTNVLAVDCAKSVRATWRDSVEKSENLLQFSYVHNRRALEQAISPDSGERFGYAYQQQAIEGPEETDRGLSTTGFATMSSYQAAKKAYDRFHVNTNAGRQLGRAATSGIHDVHSCHSSSTASPKSVIQADHSLEGENDFGDCDIKDNQSTRRDEVIVSRKANGHASAQSHLRLCSEDNSVQCKACGPSCGVQSTSGLQDEPGSEEAEIECVWKEDNTMEREGNNGPRKPTTNIEKEEHCPYPRAPLHQKGNEPVGETEKLLAALELEEFRFLERRVRKEVEGIQTKLVNSPSSGESRLATSNKGLDTHFSNLSSSTNVRTCKSNFEEDGSPEQVQQPPSAEPKYQFDDKGAWSEEHRQAKHSQRHNRLASSDTADIDGSRASQKQDTAEQRPGDPMSKLVRSYFLPGKPQKVSLSRVGTSPTEDNSIDVSEGGMVLQKKVEALEAEILKFQTETRKVQRLGKEHEEKAAQLSYEKASWEHKKNADMQKFQEFKNEQMRKVKKHHQMLEKLSQEMLQLPTKKERTQIEDLKAALSEMKEEHAKKETRWRLTEKRLRGIINELTGQSHELQEEIKRYEARLHQQWQAKDSISVSKCERGTSIDYNVLSISMREMSHHISMEECTTYPQTTGVKMSSEVFEARHEELGIPDSRLGPVADLSTREMMATHEISQTKGRRRMDTASITELTEAGCTVHATATTFSKSSNHNCFVKSYEPLSGKGKENGKILQNNEPREYVDMTVGQSASGPKTMLLQASEQGHTASGNQCLGSTKAHQTNRNSETSPARAVATSEPLHQQSVNNQNFDGRATVSSRGNMEDRQHEHSSNAEKSSFPRDGKQDEEHVSVDDCVYFANGDIKNTLPDGSIEYYYSEVDTWHTTKPSGVEIFYFPDYQVEEHWPNGQKKIISPDGSFYVIGGD